MLRPTRIIMRLRSIDLELDMDDSGTIADINDSIEKNQEEYQRFYRLTQAIVGENAEIPEGVEVATDLAAAISRTGATSAEPTPAKRTRRSRNQPDPATAVAPPPLAVPATAPVTSGDPGPIPTCLDRTAPAPVAPPPPPPPAPVAPAAPPVGTLAPKVVAELHRRGDNAADGGAALVAWLAGAGLCVPGATFQEACDCVNFLDDAKLGPVAAGLGVA